MKLTTIRVLAARFEETVAFYRDVLQIPVRVDAGVYVAFDAGGFELGIYRRDLMAEIVQSIPTLPEASSDSLLINIEVDALDEVIAQLRERGVDFLTEAHEQAEWGMRVTHLRDPEGNLIELYEVLARSRG